jgi:hypothetical protein
MQVTGATKRQRVGPPCANLDSVKPYISSGLRQRDGPSRRRTRDFRDDLPWTGLDWTGLAAAAPRCTRRCASRDNVSISNDKTAFNSNANNVPARTALKTCFVYMYLHREHKP